MRVLTFVIVSVVSVAAPVRGQSPPADPVSEARHLAFSGEREAAIDLLDLHVSNHPADTEARTLLGTILSWDGEYDEARRHLSFVLDTNPTHGDALPALANLELWSDHPDRASALAASGLAANPGHSGLLVTRARALWNLSREREALEHVDRALIVDPRNETARSLRRALRDTQRAWRAGLSYRYDGFSDNRSGWQETRYHLTHQLRYGSVIGRLYRADRFGLTDHQFEVEMYPRFREGTYAYVAAAVAPSPLLFPEYRVGGDLYKSLGGGYEVSGGYRRLGFANAVNIYVGSLTKYWRDWMYTGRAFVTPSDLGASTSFHGIARSYDDDGVGYVGVRYGHGVFRDEVRSLNDITTETSDTFAAEWLKPVGTFNLSLGGSLSREGRALRGDLWQFGFSTSLAVRF